MVLINVYNVIAIVPKYTVDTSASQIALALVNTLIYLQIVY